jgi:TrmH family RNA methyltransferase
VICGSGDPSNLGALMRSAAPLGSAADPAAEAAHPFQPQALRRRPTPSSSWTVVRGPAWPNCGRAAGPIVALDAAERTSRVSVATTCAASGEEGLACRPACRCADWALPTTGDVASQNATLAQLPSTSISCTQEGGRAERAFLGNVPPFSTLLFA